MSLTIDLPQDIAAALKIQAQAEGLSESGFSAQLLAEALAPANHFNFTPARKAEIRQQIEDGLQSLREGKSIDGEEFFARFDRELDQLERDGHK